MKYLKLILSDIKNLFLGLLIAPVKLIHLAFNWIKNYKTTIADYIGMSIIYICLFIPIVFVSFFPDTAIQKVYKEAIFESYFNYFGAIVFGAFGIAFCLLAIFMVSCLVVFLGYCIFSIIRGIYEYIQNLINRAKEENIS